MAKVTMPLMSGSASGSIGKNIVFFGWKGRAVVREWLKPANPESAKQGNARLILGGTGRACGEVKPSSDYHMQLLTLDVIPSGQTKQSFLVKYIRDHYLYNDTKYGNELTAVTGHTAYAGWQAAADAVGLVEFDVSYASIDPYNKTLGLYLLAKTAIALGFTGAPYSTALANWDAAKINDFVADLAAPV